MNPSDIINIITAAGTIAAVVVALLAIRHANRSSRQQIVTGKLEELYQTVEKLGTYHNIFMTLFHSVLAYKDQDNHTIRSLKSYYDERDKYLTEADKFEAVELLTRIEVLAECYATEKLKQELLDYYNIMGVFLELVWMGGSLAWEVKYREVGFPNYDEYRELVAGLKKQIVAQIKMR